MHTKNVVLLATVALSACKLEAQGELLHVVGSRMNSSSSEVQSLVDDGEALLAGIAALHPPETVMEDSIRVELHGRFRNTSPYVDDDGTVHLWRFSAAEGGYGALYTHELVHAIAFHSLVVPALEGSERSGFYLEGWAEYAALQVQPEKTGFPLFGYDEDVVVGHWLNHGGPSLADLRARHTELSLPCQGQSYILRASWFRFVEEELGQEAMWKLVAPEDGLDDAAVEAALGRSLAELDADWATWAMARYDAVPDADAQADAYMGRMGWYTPCTE